MQEFAGGMMETITLVMDKFNLENIKKELGKKVFQQVPFENKELIRVYCKNKPKTAKPKRYRSVTTFTRKYLPKNYTPLKKIEEES